MNLIRDWQRGRLVICDENKNSLLELGWMYDEFVWILNSSKPIVINKELDDIFYNNLNYLMDNNYEFYINEKLSYKQQNKIQWLSDQYGDLQDEKVTDTINRLLIERKENEIIILAQNPFCIKQGIDKKQYVVAFSPSGNGNVTKNKSTNSTFQNDMVSVYTNTMQKVNMKEKIKLKEREEDYFEL